MHQFICFVESFRSISGDVINHVPLGALHCVLNDDMLDMNEKLLNRFIKVYREYRHLVAHCWDGMGWVRDQSFTFKGEGVYDFPPDVQKKLDFIT